jgi:hypothetical protein
MALSLEDPNLVKQKCRAESRKPDVQAGLKALFSYISQHLSSPNLQFVPFTELSSGSTASVIADVPCKLYGLFIQSPAAAANKAYAKFTDDETTASATAFEVGLGITATKQIFLSFPQGKSMANGIAARGDTAIDGSTGSAAADRVSGFAIVGGP